MTTYLYFCDKCKFNTNDKTKYNRHLQTIKHKGENIKKVFECSKCDYVTNNKSNYNRHCNICEIKPTFEDTKLRKDIYKIKNNLELNEEEKINEINKLKENKKNIIKQRPGRKKGKKYEKTIKEENKEDKKYKLLEKRDNILEKINDIEEEETKYSEDIENNICVNDYDKFMDFSNKLKVLHEKIIKINNKIKALKN